MCGATVVSIYRIPNVDAERFYVYYDPLGRLPEANRRRWAEPDEHVRMVKEAVLAVGLNGFQPACPLSCFYHRPTLAWQTRLR